MILRAVSLEEFNPDADGTGTDQPRRDPAFDAGYEAGYQDASAKTEQEQTALRHSFVAALEDLHFTQTEARTHVLSALQPLLRQLVEQTVPQILSDGFSAHLIGVLSAAAEEAVQGPLTLLVPPAQIAAAEAALTGLPDDLFTLKPDAALEPDTALIIGWDSETLLDLSALTTALQTALSGLLLPERTQTHG